MELPDTRYAITPDGVYLAYQVAGRGSVDIAMQLEYAGNIEDEWDEPLSMNRSLAAFSRLILHDRRGVGLSSRNVPPPNLETRVADLEVVLDAAGSERTVLWGFLENGAPNVMFAAANPARVHSIVWLEPKARCTWAPDYPWGNGPEELEEEERVLALWGTAEYGRAFQQQQASRDNMISDAAVAAMAKAARHACTPDVAKALSDLWLETDISGVLPAVQVPALLLVHGERDTGEAEYVASLMPRAELKKMPGDAWEPDEMPRWAEEIRRFIGVESPTTGLDRVLTTVLFTDIVGSTERLTELGDSRWKGLLAAHDERTRREIARHGGRYIDSTGDGVLATFDGPARAVRCAQAIGSAVRDLGIQIRAGIHTGEVELDGDDVRGISVHIGARVAALGGASEVLVSQTVKDLTAGSGLSFKDRGEYELKGVPDRWHLYRVVA